MLLCAPARKMDQKFIIATDATCDLPEEYISTHKILVLPMSYTIDTTTYTGAPDSSLSGKEFYASLRAGSIAKTAQINPDQYQQHFEPYLKEGTSVLYIGFSSALSGSVQSARIAAETLNETYDAKLYIVDSLCASAGEGLLVDYARALRDSGATLEGIQSWLEENKLHLCHNFTVDDLHFLHRGGRVSKTAAIFGSMLGVKPVMHVNNEGKLVPIAKVRGRRQSLVALVDNLVKAAPGYANDRIFIGHGDCLEDAEFVAQLVRDRINPKEIIITYISPIIGAHSGPGTVALFSMGDSRHTF